MRHPLRLLLLIGALAHPLPSLAGSCAAPGANYPTPDFPHYLPDAGRLYRELTGLGEAWEYRLNTGQLRWQRLAEAMGEPPPHGYPECSYDYASETLLARLRLTDPAPARAFVRNQNRVLQNCTAAPGYGTPLPLDPGELPVGASPEGERIAAYDLAYQRAMARFYQERGSRFAQALPAFETIAAAIESPHRDAARLMVARIQLRRSFAGSHGGEPEQEEKYPERLHEAMAALDDILADPAMARFHPAAGTLIGHAAYHTGDPRLLRRQLLTAEQALLLPAGVISEDAELSNIHSQALEDLEWFLTPAQRPDGPRSRALADLASERPVLAWLRAWGASQAFHAHAGWFIQAQVKAELGYEALTAEVLTQLRQSQGALPWLVVALARVTPDHPEVDELLAGFYRLRKRIAACNAGRPERFAYALAFYHAVRLHLGRDELPKAFELLEGERPPDLLFHLATPLAAARWLAFQGKVEEARRLLPLLREMREDYFLPMWEVVPLMQLLARSQEEFLAIDREGKYEGATAAVLNLLPAARIAALLDADRIPPRYRLPAARMAWLRAWLLGRESLLEQLTPKLMALEPEAAQGLAPALATWWPGRRRHLTDLFIARSPRMGLFIFTAQAAESRGLDHQNPNDNNWWCPLDRGRLDRALHEKWVAHALGLPEGPEQLEESVPGAAEAVARLLTGHPALQGVDQAELDALARVPSGPRYLSEQAIAWAGESGWLSRIFGWDHELAEALALAVRATRWGCRRAGGHGSYSRQAFTVLHQRFPDSPEARRTGYWFDVIR